MLPKEKRLNLKKDFKWVTSGRKLDTSYLRLFLKEGDPSLRQAQGKLTGPRIGIATSSKFFRKSSQRNRARRLVSAALQSLYPLLPSHLNIVVLPKHSILDVKSSDVFLDLEKKLTDGKIIT